MELPHQIRLTKTISLLIVIMLLCPILLGATPLDVQAESGNNIVSGNNFDEGIVSQGDTLLLSTSSTLLRRLKLKNWGTFLAFLRKSN